MISGGAVVGSGGGTDSLPLTDVLVVVDVRLFDSFASPFVTFEPCFTVVIIDFMMAELDVFSVVSPIPFKLVMFDEFKLNISLFLAVDEDWLVWVLNTDSRPTISSVVVEQSVVVVAFKWSRTESIVMSPMELVIVSFALFGDASSPLAMPLLSLGFEVPFVSAVALPVTLSPATDCSLFAAATEPDALLSTSRSDASPC